MCGMENNAHAKNSHDLISSHKTKNKNHPLSQLSFMVIKLSAGNHHPGMLNNSNDAWEYNCYHPKWLQAESPSLKNLSNILQARPVRSLIVKFSLQVHRFHAVHQKAVKDRLIWQLSGVGKVVVCVCECYVCLCVWERRRVYGKTCQLVTN